MVNKVVVIAHLEKPAVLAEAQKLVSYLRRRQVDVVMPAGDEALLRSKPGLTFTDDLAGDLVLVLGGDGTMLRTIRTLKNKSTPILGVNFGKVGFLSEIEVDQLYKALPKVLKGDHVCEKRRLIDARIHTKSKKIYRHLALNEIVIERKYFGRLIELVVQIDGKVFNRYFADGLVVATPTGSTAYSFSAGGPVVSPGTSSMMLTPICAHSLFGRTVVLSDKEVVTVNCPTSVHSGVVVSIDGWEIFDDDQFSKVELRMSAVAANLVKIGSRTFYDILREKIRVWDLSSE